MRQHVNPLSRFFQQPFALPLSSDLFEDDSLPIHLDIGSARGRFLIDMAKMNKDWNHLGIEIRELLVIAAEKERKELDLNNIKFLFCNANISLLDWLESLNHDQLQRVSIQFPDPWFKRRHFKRRVLQPDLLTSIAKALSPSRELFIQSDIYEVIQSMIVVIEESNFFKRIIYGESEWLYENPYDVCSERELYVLNQEKKVYRAMFQRNLVQCSS